MFLDKSPALELEAMERMKEALGIPEDASPGYFEFITHTMAIFSWTHNREFDPQNSEDVAECRRFLILIKTFFCEAGKGQVGLVDRVAEILWEEISPELSSIKNVNQLNSEEIVLGIYMYVYQKRKKPDFTHPDDRAWLIHFLSERADDLAAEMEEFINSPECREIQEAARELAEKLNLPSALGKEDK